MRAGGSLALTLTMPYEDGSLEEETERMLDGLGKRWTRADDGGWPIRTVTYEWSGSEGQR